MSSEGIVAVSAAVVALTQILKWAGLRDSWAPLAVIGLSVLGVLVWLVSGTSWPPTRTDVWPIFSGVIAVTLAAAGTFGFTRAGASAVTSLSTPPVGGAGSEPSIKSADTDLDGLAERLERRRQERVEANIRKANDGVKAPSRVES
jgi:vacuolar-type H+-ATPase subunit I/STV1